MKKNNKIPARWAQKLACERSDFIWVEQKPTLESMGLSEVTSNLIRAHARTIEQNEEPPVDPDLIEAREIWAKGSEEQNYFSTATRYRNGEYDSLSMLQNTYKGVKRGRELERKENI